MVILNKHLQILRYWCHRASIKGTSFLNPLQWQMNKGWGHTMFRISVFFPSISWHCYLSPKFSSRPSGGTNQGGELALPCKMTISRKLQCLEMWILIFQILNKKFIQVPNTLIMRQTANHFRRANLVQSCPCTALYSRSNCLHGLLKCHVVNAQTSAGMMRGKHLQYFS